LLCAEGRYDEALGELDGTIHRTHAANSKGELVRLLALQAVAFAATGSRQAACSVLREAAALSAPDGYVRRWLDAGPSIGPLLRELRHQGDTPVALHPYLDGLLDACRSTFGDLALQPASKMLDPLTARELEVMRLICAGYTNPEIAGELVVTLNTIKKHTSNIYGKLGVRGRTQAIARVHELNLL
jgi:LuxR family maltose regulon positive regulatory protein